MNKKYRMEESIRLVQEWKLSGMTQVEFAKVKGLTERQIEYQVRKVRQQSPESISDSALEKVDFIPVPQEYLNCTRRMYDASEMSDQPALMFQTGIGCLHVTNQIDPYLLKVAMEVMLSC